MREDGFERVPRITLSEEDFSAIESVDYALSSNVGNLLLALGLIAEGAANERINAMVATHMTYLKDHSAQFKRNKDALATSSNPHVVDLGTRLEAVDVLLTQLLIEADLVMAGTHTDITTLEGVADNLRELARTIIEQPAYFAYRQRKKESDRPVNA